MCSPSLSSMTGVRELCYLLPLNKCMYAGVTSLIWKEVNHIIWIHNVIESIQNDFESFNLLQNFRFQVIYLDFFGSCAGSYHVTWRSCSLAECLVESTHKPQTTPCLCCSCLAWSAGTDILPAPELFPSLLPVPAGVEHVSCHVAMLVLDPCAVLQVILSIAMRPASEMVYWFCSAACFRVKLLEHLPSEFPPRYNFWVFPPCRGLRGKPRQTKGLESGDKMLGPWREPAGVTPQQISELGTDKHLGSCLEDVFPSPQTHTLSTLSSRTSAVLWGTEPPRLQNYWWIHHTLYV